VTARAPLAPLLVLGGVVAGVLAGEALGPGPARVALGMGALGAIGAVVGPRGRTRVALAVLGFALLGSASMQRATCPTDILGATLSLRCVEPGKCAQAGNL
jgi:hypothetical protein